MSKVKTKNKNKNKKKAAEEQNARKVTEFWAPKSEKSSDPQESQKTLSILSGTAIPDTRTQHQESLRDSSEIATLSHVINWHERAAFQRSSFGRSRSGGRLLATT